MDADEFESRMRDADIQHRKVPVSYRFLHVFFSMSKQKCIVLSSAYDPTIGPYEGVNLHLKILDWYTKRYPEHMTLSGRFGHRLIEIRGEIFLSKIPMIINPSKALDAFKYILNLSPFLIDDLDAAERNRVVS